MKSSSIFPLMFVSLLLGACAHQSKPPVITNEHKEVTPPPAQVEVSKNNAPSLLEFVSYFSELSLEAQKKELSQVLQKINVNSNTIHQKTRAAIIYAIPASKLRDPAKAQPLLDELAQEKKLSPEERAIVGILKEYAAETSKLTQRLRDEQRRAEENQQKANGLQQKLDELKKIERTMMQKSLKDPNRSSSK